MNSAIIIQYRSILACLILAGIITLAFIVNAQAQTAAPTSSTAATYIPSNTNSSSDTDKSDSLFQILEAKPKNQF